MVPARARCRGAALGAMLLLRLHYERRLLADAAPRLRSRLAEASHRVDEVIRIELDAASGFQAGAHPSKYRVGFRAREGGAIESREHVQHAHGRVAHWVSDVFADGMIGEKAMPQAGGVHARTARALCITLVM